MTSIQDCVNQICLELPETDVIVSHGSPNYRVRNKSFAYFSLNHHGDGKVALLLNASHESQQMLVDAAPKHFFVPPYIGPKGWLGVELNRGLSWSRISQLVFEAYTRSAPATLSRNSQPVECKPPTEKMTAADIDPLKSQKNQKIINKLRDLCLALPETTEATQFGSPCFKAGKKSFCTISHDRGETPPLTKVQIWVGADRQDSLISFDKRFDVPAYIGHNGWINLNITNKQDWQEIEQLLLQSYKHFALKRMLKEIA